ncbi:MAG: phosphate regulon transcriptional regulator PhoB [Magnetospiraceae bacterium]
MSARILVVEDDPSLCEVLRYNLEHDGYEVALSTDGEDGLIQVQEWWPDLLILDWMLPGMSGLDICRTIRNDPALKSLPVVMLTARGEEADRVRGLNTGADDYMVKPFSPNELLARVRAVLRRTSPTLIGEELSYEGISMNLTTHKVTRDGTAVKLGPTEFRLLKVFMERPGRVFSREQLLDRAWGHNIHVEPRTVDVHIRRLRQALNTNGGDDIIRTVRSAGYSLDIDRV